MPAIMEQCPKCGTTQVILIPAAAIRRAHHLRGDGQTDRQIDEATGIAGLLAAVEEDGVFIDGRREDRCPACGEPFVLADLTWPSVLREAVTQP